MKLADVFFATHKSLTNRILHYVSIILILASLCLCLFSWQWGIKLTFVGLALMVLGHVIEGEPPAFIQLKRQEPH